MPNYDAESDAAAEQARHEAAVDFEVDHERDPVDPVENATRGPGVGDAGSMELLASYNLRRIRLAMGLSQQQIADKLAQKSDRVRLSQSQLAKMERGERPWRLNELYEIADALGIDHMEFFSGGHRSSDTKDLLVLAERLRYQAMWEAASTIEEDYKAAVRKALEAGQKLVDTAVYLGVKDPMAMHILEGRASRVEEVDVIVEELDTPPGQFPARVSREELEERMRKSEEANERNRAWAEEEWKRLTAAVAEAKEKAADQ